MVSFVTGAPRTIAVDLTPVLPGGENGGAKIFVLTLLRGLARMAPDTQFVLLTQFASHDELAALDRSNVRRVMVLAPEGRARLRPLVKRVASRILSRIPGRLRRVASRFTYDVNAYLKRGASPSLLRDLGADLLFCPFTAPIYGDPRLPTVCTIYDLQYKTFPEFFTPDEAALRERTFAEASRQSTMLAAISDYSRQSAIDHGAIDPARIRTIHLRMAGRIASSGPGFAETLARLGLSPGRYVLYPANFWLHKNHEMLITAFGIACADGLPADIRLVCTGAPGPRSAWLSMAAQRLGLHERIVFPGYVPDEALSTLMAHAGAMIFPSLYEGFGLPVIEAMKAGVPVACSDTTSLPEVAAGAASLFDPRIPLQIAEAIRTVMGDEAVRTRLREAGRGRAAEFADDERMVREYWALFLEAMTRWRGAAVAGSAST